MTNTDHDNDVNERALVDAARGGSIQSFELLVERYHTRILNYLMCQTNDHDMATDLTQQTFLDVFRELERLPADRPFCAWLYRVAHNNMLSECRRRHLRQFVSMQWLLETMGNEPPPLRTSDDTMACHERELIQHVLNSISPPLREALLLHSVGGFLSEEVAHILNISPATARQRICRAKEQFRMRYHTLNGDDYDAEMQPLERRLNSAPG